MELFDDDGFLPILDIEMRITENGGIERKLFTKAAKRGIMLHFLSHHPRAIETTVANNEMQRTILPSTAEHRDKSHPKNNRETTQQRLP